MNDVTGQYHIRTLRTRTEIETLREFWSSCGPCRDADLDFYLFIIDLYPEALRPHVVVLYDGEVPKALLAGRLDASSVPVKAGYVTIPVPRMRILQIVHGGWLGEISDANAERLIGSIVETLSKGEADVALLHCPNLSSPLVHCAEGLPYRWCSDHLISPQAHRVLDLSEVTGPFLASLSQNERYQQRKRARRIEQDFNDHRIELLTTPDEVERIIQDAEAVAAKSYQRGLNIGFSETPIIRSRLNFEARKGWLRAYILYLNKRPSAFWIGSLRDRVFLSDYLAFDPAYAKYGPGMYLIVKVMEELCRDRCDGAVALERIDFGIGDASYKERLSNRHWQESPVYIFAPSIKAVGVNALRSAMGLMSHSAKGLVGMTPLLDRIKRMWRRRVTESG
jgi:Acetyltransferase (GNAT) domain